MARSDRHLTTRNARRRSAAAAALADRLLLLCRAVHRVGRAAARRVSIPHSLFSSRASQTMSTTLPSRPSTLTSPTTTPHYSHARRSSPTSRSTFRSARRHAARALHSHAYLSLSIPRAGIVSCRSSSSY